MQRLSVDLGGMLGRSEAGQTSRLQKASWLTRMPRRAVESSRRARGEHLGRTSFLKALVLGWRARMPVGFLEAQPGHALK